MERMALSYLLDGVDWEFKGFVGEAWRGVEDPGKSDVREWKSATVPGTVYHDLLVHGEILDPYYERNSLFCEWVPARYWAFRKHFRLGTEFRGKRVQLRFEGIDYSGRVFLNGVDLGSHEGMFVPASFDVTNFLRFDEDNFLVVVLDPAPIEQPQVGRTSLVRTHKSRMTYWWDFCPRMIHVGIWDSVYLQATGFARLDDVYVNAEYSRSASCALVSVHASLSVPENREFVLRAEISRDGQLLESYEEMHMNHDEDTALAFTMNMENPDLWWPNASGEPNLYDMTVTVLVDGQESDVKKVRFGVRSIELAHNIGASSDALPYTFVVNGDPTYIKGWNWVPMDVMYGLRQPEKLRHLLTLAKSANVNLLRVWGGGLIEREEFYDLCDEFGIMVWQEWIQSSSGIENKPSETPEFVEMMVRQAEAIIPRRRNHASLVLWCGGNELQDLNGRPLDDSEPVLHALRDVVERLHPGSLWLPTSPTGPLFMNSLVNIEQDPTGLHDVHGPWEHQGLTEQYHLYNQGTSLFHSEFGVEGMANRRTIQETISKEMQWPATRDNPVWNHRGSWWINEPLIQQCFGGIHDLDTLMNASQFLQAEGLRYAVEANQRRAFHNSGTIPWQFNESYPNGYCTASVDYYGRPKPAYYSVARAYRPISITAAFDTQAWQGYENFKCNVYVRSSEREAIKGQIRAAVIGATGQSYHTTGCSVVVEGNQVTAGLDLQLPLHKVEEDVFFLDLSFSDERGDVSTNRYVFSKTADLASLLQLPKTTLQVRAQAGAQGEVAVTIHNAGPKAALCVRLEDTLPLVTNIYLYFSDNGFHLLPGETRDVRIWACEATSAQVSVAAWNTDTEVVECPSFGIR